jgi:fucose 4-O-acetylase-like acetyltransferase
MKIEWIDVIKGIGIVFVVAGHTYIGEVKDFIFLFHMPLFFFISGFLFTQQEHKKNILILS